MSPLHGSVDHSGCSDLKPSQVCPWRHHLLKGLWWKKNRGQKVFDWVQSMIIKRKRQTRILGSRSCLNIVATDLWRWCLLSIIFIWKKVLSFNFKMYSLLAFLCHRCNASIPTTQGLSSFIFVAPSCSQTPLPSSNEHLQTFLLIQERIKSSFETHSPQTPPSSYFIRYFI